MAKFPIVDMVDALGRARAVVILQHAGTASRAGDDPIEEHFLLAHADDAKRLATLLRVFGDTLVVYRDEKGRFPREDAIRTERVDRAPLGKGQA